MTALLYIKGQTGLGVDEIEDALDDALSGIGGVTGTGTGADGSNFDLELRSAISLDDLSRLLRGALAQVRVVAPASLVVDGVRVEVLP